MTDIVERMRNGAALIVIRHNETGASDLFVEAADEIERLRARIAELEQENTRLIEDRARFPDRPDDIGRMIGAHIGNLKSAKSSSDKYAAKYRDERDAAQRRIAELEAQRVPDRIQPDTATTAKSDSSGVSDASPPAPAVVDEREAFEKWLLRTYPNATTTRCPDGYIGTVPHRIIQSTYASVQMLWEAWRSRAQLGAVPVISQRHVLAITTAYEQGVGKGHYAAEHGKEISNPYAPEWGCDIAWQMGYDEGKAQADYEEGMNQVLAAQLDEEPVGFVSQDFLDGKWNLDHIAKTDTGQISRVIPVFTRAQLGTVPEYNGWYCAQCERGVDPSEVTFNEAHTECGRIITNDRPPALTATGGRDEQDAANWRAFISWWDAENVQLTERIDADNDRLFITTEELIERLAAAQPAQEQS